MFLNFIFNKIYTLKFFETKKKKDFINFINIPKWFIGAGVFRLMLFKTPNKKKFKLYLLNQVKQGINFGLCCKTTKIPSFKGKKKKNNKKKIIKKNKSQKNYKLKKHIKVSNDVVLKKTEKKLRNFLN